ncbi:MAG: single-stranded DNA-binding protein [Candidatus Competibacteraceae bacterium]|nr:single-stranded DNA-binding protein [Candidatus Competibacteraceae bacterium]
MADINRFVVSGRLTKDAEMKQVGESQLVVFSLASNDYYKGAEYTNFFDCSIWGKYGESIYKYLTKAGQSSLTAASNTSDSRERMGPRGLPISSPWIRSLLGLNRKVRKTPTPPSRLLMIFRFEAKPPVSRLNGKGGASGPNPQ